MINNYNTSDNLETVYGSHYEIISTVAYIGGVPYKFFESETATPKMNIYEKLESERPARIIRNLCLLRTLMMQYNQEIYNGMVREKKSLLGMSDCIPMALLQQLADDGIDIYSQTNAKSPNDISIFINKTINERLGDVRRFFPTWLNWDYLKTIFLVPNGNTVEGIKAAADFYYAEKQNDGALPYRQYFNIPADNHGNILYCDQKFVTLLYSWNKDEFKDLNLVQDIGSRAKESVYDFIDKSNRCVIIVECENSDPYDMCAALKGLDEAEVAKIDKIILFDDINASSAWSIMDKYIDVEVESVVISRIKANKSLTDVMVAARICKEFYENKTDSIIIASSDSDYWGVINSLPEVNFLVMVEHEKCSEALKSTLRDRDIFYCYIDDFYAKGGEEIRQDAFRMALKRELESRVQLNLHQIINEVLTTTRISMGLDEINDLIHKTIAKRLSCYVTEEGIVNIEYNIRRAQ